MNNTKKSKKKIITSNWVMTYEINGRRYTYENIYLDECGIPYGYCKRNRVWAWLYPDAVSIQGREVGLIPATKIDTRITNKKG